MEDERRSLVIEKRGAPKAVLGIVIAMLVLLPESWAAAVAGASPASQRTRVIESTEEALRVGGNTSQV